MEKKLAEAAANAADLLSAEEQEAARKQAKRDKVECQRAAKQAEAARKVTSRQSALSHGNHQVFVAQKELGQLKVIA
jgi:hypothetical protein